jgi:hypothetical protein
MARRAGPYLLVLVLVLWHFWPLFLRPGEVLYAPHSDLPDLHVPAKQFLVHATRQYGELPLWCPHELSGAPFVHDIQAAIFYPPHLLLHLLPEERVGAGLSWLIVFHIVLAGWGGVAYGRWRGLGTAGASVVGIGCAFAGRWLLHLLAGGHYIVVGLAWLPWLLLAMEHALRRPSAAWVTVAGCLYALLLLGTHPQWTFYASLLVLWMTLGATLDQTGRWCTLSDEPRLSLRRALTRWLVVGLGVVVIGVGLAAVQLLPTVEAAGLATRSDGVSVSGALDGGLRSLLFLIGPVLSPQPHNLEWEDRGGLTFVWLMAAITAGVVGRGRVRFDAGVALGLCLFAIGASVLLQGLPLFRLFRQPPRMFVLLGLPVALLAGQAVDWLVGGGCKAEEISSAGRKVLVRLLAAVVILTGGYVLRGIAEGRDLHGHLYWWTLLFTVPAAMVLLRAGPHRFTAWAWCGLLVLDLCSLTAPLVDTRPEASLYAPPGCLTNLLHHPLGHGRLLDRSWDGAFPLGAGAPLALVHGLEAVRGYNPLDSKRYKEYLQLAGGSDAPLRALDGPLGFPILGDFAVTEKQLLDLLNVRYLLQPAAAPPPAGWHGPLATDTGPRVFNFLTGGVPELPPYALYENTDVLPRAFVVFQAMPLPTREHLVDSLRATDLRRVVLLETDSSPDYLPSVAPSPPREAVVQRYTTNRVEVQVSDGTAGWLVLTDLWYPGWTCSIDGEPSVVLRADYAFRAVKVASGPHTVVFTFAPSSFAWGRRISFLMVGGVIGALLLSWLRWVRQAAAGPGGSRTAARGPLVAVGRSGAALQEVEGRG